MYIPGYIGGSMNIMPEVQVVNPLFQNPNPIISTDPFLSDADTFEPMPALPSTGGLLTGGSQVPLAVAGGATVGGGALAMMNQAQANNQRPPGIASSNVQNKATLMNNQVASPAPEVIPEVQNVINDINNIPVKKPTMNKEEQVSDTDVKKGVDGVLDKIFNMQENNPEAYKQFIRGAYFYEAGQQGQSITQAMLGYSKFNNAQQKALLDASLKLLDIKAKTAKIGQDDIKFNLDVLKTNAQIENYISQTNDRYRKANEDSASYPSGITTADMKSRLENKIEADFFAGIKDKPTENINSLVDQLEPLAKANLLSGMDINTAVSNAIDIAVQVNAITPSFEKPGRIYGSTTVPGSVDASMFGQASRVKVNTQAEYDQLPSGTRYIDGDGIPGIKP